MTFERFVTIAFAAPWLGHGRRVESFLAAVAAIYGFVLLIDPQTAKDSKATYELVWYGVTHWLAVALLLKALLTGSGLALNITGYEFSWLPRFLGAWLGFVIWAWHVAQLGQAGAFATAGFCFSLPASFYSIQIMGFAYANLPRPGTAGAS